MAWEQPNFVVSYQAAKDLSSYQYQLVAITTACKVTNITCVAAKKIGVLQNNPTSGMEANVVAIGVTKVKAAGAISCGDAVRPTATTTYGGGVVAMTSVTKGHSIGYALQAAAQGGDIIPIQMVLPMQV